MGERAKKVIWLIIIVGLILRICLAVYSENPNHSDENFQITEQAHRLVFGYGIIPWEYRFDARSWLVPGLVAIMLYPFKIAGIDDPTIYIPAIKIFMAIFSLSVILSAYSIGKSLSSIKAGLYSALFCSLWYDIIYFSIRPLSEVWATIFFITALAIFLKKQSYYCIILSAMLACLTGAIRINYIPAALILLIIALFKLQNKSRTIYLISFLGTAAAYGIFEWITLGQPYASYINLYEINKTYFMAGSIGSGFSFEYFMFLGFSSLFILWLFLIMGIKYLKENKILITLILFTLAANVLIPGKEYQKDFRHVFLFIPLLMIIGGISISKLPATSRKLFNLLRPAIITGLFLIISTFGALGALPGQNTVYEGKIFNPYADTIFGKRPQFQAYKFLYSLKDLVGLYDVSETWFKSGAFYYLHRNVPIYYDVNPPALPEFISHLMTKGRPQDLPGFEIIKRFEDINIYARIDSRFPYQKDLNYNFNIPQPGVDDTYAKSHWSNLAPSKDNF